MKKQEALNIETGTILRLGSSYYRVGVKDGKNAFLYHSDKSGSVKEGNVGMIDLMTHNFEVHIGVIDKRIEDAKEF